jgi:hypothetical protein
MLACTVPGNIYELVNIVNCTMPFGSLGISITLNICEIATTQL